MYFLKQVSGVSSPYLKLFSNGPENVRNSDTHVIFVVVLGVAVNMLYIIPYMKYVRKRNFIHRGSNR